MLQFSDLSEIVLFFRNVTAQLHVIRCLFLIISDEWHIFIKLSEYQIILASVTNYFILQTYLIPKPCGQQPNVK